MGITVSVLLLAGGITAVHPLDGDIVVGSPFVDDKPVPPPPPHEDTAAGGADSSSSSSSSPPSTSTVDGAAESRSGAAMAREGGSPGASSSSSSREGRAELGDKALYVTEDFTRATETFMSGDDECHGWLYWPRKPAYFNGGTRVALVIMAHGFGQQKDFGLERYAERFSREGLAVLAFDYRSFGLSEGQPRNYVSPKRHVEDWLAAIDHVCSPPLRDILDTDRLMLFGTSFSGGHTLMAAAQRRVRCVVSQAPFLRLDMADERGHRGLVGLGRLLAAAATDHVRSVIGLSPAYIKIATDRRDELALMVMSPEEYQVYQKLQPDQKLGGWINLAPSRVLWEMIKYNPLESIEKVKCPILFVAGEKDTISPLHTIVTAFERSENGSLYTREEANHFQLYFEHFDAITNRAVDFFKWFCDECHVLETVED